MLNRQKNDVSSPKELLPTLSRGQKVAIFRQTAACKFPTEDIMGADNGGTEIARLDNGGRGCKSEL